MMKIFGINGFGRFGIHLLRFYLKNQKKNKFLIKYINDKSLTFTKIKQIISNDEYIKLHEFDLKFNKNSITFFSKSKNKFQIFFTNTPIKRINWLNSIDYFLECGGEKIQNLRFILKQNNNIKNIILSATSHEVNKTLIYGFNHKEYTSKFKTISYGSCTVNAFVPLANVINKFFLIENCDVNVIHNLSENKLKNKENYKIERRFCTLTSSAPKLLKFINKNNFNVNYSLVPYSGPSIMDIRFKLKKKPQSLKSLITKIKNELKTIYDFDVIDKGSNSYKFILNNLKIIISNSSLKDKTLYLSGYFDNENSVVRFYDIINHILQTNNIKNVKKM